MKSGVYKIRRLTLRRGRGSARRGFALVVTLSLMILLTVIAVGLLTLSSISLRSSSLNAANAEALANARLGLMLAIGQLQNHAGDDRRITADAAFSPSAAQPRLVGVWNSWTPNMIARADGPASNYNSAKDDNFRSWLTSAPNPDELMTRGWADSAVGADWVELFSPERDGFSLAAPTVNLPTGAYAWVVSQENTKAKVNVAGPDDQDLQPVNAALQVQPRPSMGLSQTLAEPKDNWNLRAQRVISTNQITLDEELAPDPDKAALAGASYTVTSQGLLTDTLKGGLKVDLNLGFELSDSEFSGNQLGKRPNPFRSASSNAPFNTPSSFNGQQALFRPILENPIVSTVTSFDPANVSNRFYGAAVPTFDHLRSFYRIPHHLYGSGGSPTVRERGGDHVAVDSKPASGGSYLAPANPPPGRKSELAIRPVLDRVVYILSMRVGSDSEVRLVMTPVVTLWNPYNVALEITGAVAYPWIDVPFGLTWDFNVNGTTRTYSAGMANLMGKQFEAQNHGRTIDPYFFCEITAGGNGSLNSPIRFEPGEIRVFTPRSDVPIEFIRKSNNAARTIQMWPVDDISRLKFKGGLSVPMKNGVGGTGFNQPIKQGDTVKVRVTDAAAGQRLYNYFVSLEDSTRIANKSDSARGQAVTEVQVLRFASEGIIEVSSPYRSFTELQIGTPPFGVLETFHRVARQANQNQAIADLVYTTNPRQPNINHLLSAGSFTAAPHYQSTLRQVTTLDGAIETSTDGRQAFWGATTRSEGGERFLPFFEIPRDPMLSLASFQHADLSSSTFSPSNQFGNSWASPYLGANRAGVRYFSFIGSGVPIYDTAYLTNEALWDGYFFSGAAPRLEPAASAGSDPWANDIARTTRTLKKVVEDFVANPLVNPMGNSRMRLYRGGLSDKELSEMMLSPEGCLRIAAHLTVDGAFNVNSTDLEAWTAFLSGMRGQPFDVIDGSTPSSTQTGFPRFRHPIGGIDHNWRGFRALSDAQVRTLATNIVEEVKKRGPFLSLAEFVNRRIESGELGYRGAIQAAIDTSNLNSGANQASFSVSKYPAEARRQIDNNTGVGIPGFLTQADVLQSLAPVITPRSDTFTIRSYGEARNKAGVVIARARCEAVVQRVPDFVDPTSPADSAIADLTMVNQKYGRRFELVSYRIVPPAELN